MAHSAACFWLALQVLEFVDEHGNEVLNLGSFTLLPEHVVRLILSREDLRADEFTKFQVSMAPRLAGHPRTPYLTRSHGGHAFRGGTDV